MNLLMGILTGPVFWVVVIALIAIFSFWKKSPQDKAIVVTGLKRRVISGGGGFVIPFFEQTNRISLENIKVEVKTRDSLDKDGVPVCTDGVVLVKINSKKDSILYAMEQFNTGKEKETIEVIRSTVQDVLEGKIREIVSQLSIKDLYSNRQSFGEEIEKVAKEDLEKMGLEIKAFTIRDISDHNGYLDALGVKQISQVKKEAAIAQADADREQMEKTSESKRRGSEAMLSAETEIAKAEKDKELRVQAYEEEKFRAKAKADLAYEIEKNKVRKEVVETEKAAQLLEEQRQTEIAKQQAMRKEQELEASVKKQAEADKFKVERESEARRFTQIQSAEAEAEQIRLRGQAEADAIRLKGQAQADAMKAEAEAMKEKAEAYKLYGDAAIIEILVAKLPEIAKNMADPLSKTEKMVIIDNGGEGGANRVTKNIANMVSNVPEVVESLTGIDLTQLVKNFTNKKEGEMNLDDKAVNALLEKLQASPDGMKKLVEAINKK
jgi:flotillin